MSNGSLGYFRIYSIQESSSIKGSEIEVCHIILIFEINVTTPHNTSPVVMIAKNEPLLNIETTRKSWKTQHLVFLRLFMNN